jgi:fatty acid synthase subunit alpha
VGFFPFPLLFHPLTQADPSCFLPRSLSPEPELFHGYDPKKKAFHQEIELTHDLEPLEVSQADAEQFKREQGDKCDTWARESGEWFVKFKRGARILVPKSIRFDRLVAGQLPTGWHAGRYGLPDDIIAQTDRFVSFSLFPSLSLQHLETD